MFTHDILASLNELEYSIYECIVRNQDCLPQMTIKELAEAAHVSTGSILRFCKKLGCDGYSHFKLCYREYLKQESLRLKETDDTAIRNFLYYADSNEFQISLNKAYKILRNSQQIIFIGIGTSGTLGKYGARYFSNIGRYSHYVEDPWQPVLQNLTKDTVTIALSESGTTPQTIDIASQLKERGSFLIAVTNHADSILSKLADCVIAYHVPEIIVNSGNITTQVPVLYIIETLARKLHTLESEC